MVAVGNRAIININNSSITDQKFKGYSVIQIGILKKMVKIL